MSIHQTKQLVADFIEAIWNQQQFEKLDLYLHPDYVDHSLPIALSPDGKGLQNWIQATSQSFLHQTFIDDQVTEASKTILKITMQMTHVGIWRGIKPTGAQVSTMGYRFYRVADGKIIDHWAAIDGTAVENQLKHQAGSGCKIPN
ncbi:ester cyclase [Spirosoma endophyticum]|uniref:SnoaL-like polyketide cyclase n=1 Tax=Spirosoma endophyticum TaxID=662367 RepID=A0A1I2FAV3_9BACT|nr:ester cyclase [Spirosoma endophyticum]SFF02512.1 SnoaL-like polyketide cyclase [Spirosoma endophyticum]